MSPNPSLDLTTDTNPDQVSLTNIKPEDKNEAFLSNSDDSINSYESDSADDSSLPMSDFTVKPRTDEGTVNGRIINGGGKRSRDTWTVEDELSLLRGMTEYMSVNGAHPSGGKFHCYLRDNLNFNLKIGRIQISDKIYRLRKDYEANVDKGVDVFSKPHKQIAFDLSKKIWGAENGLFKPRKYRKSKAVKVEGSNEGNEMEIKIESDEIGRANKSALDFASKLIKDSDIEKKLALPDFGEKLIDEQMNSRDDNGNEVKKAKIGWMEEELELRLKAIDLARRKHEYALALLRSSRA